MLRGTLVLTTYSNSSALSLSWACSAPLTVLVIGGVVGGGVTVTGSDSLKMFGSSLTMYFAVLGTFSVLSSAVR